MILRGLAAADVGRLVLAALDDDALARLEEAVLEGLADRALRVEWPIAPRASESATETAPELTEALCRAARAEAEAAQLRACIDGDWCRWKETVAEMRATVALAEHTVARANKEVAALQAELAANRHETRPGGPTGGAELVGVATSTVETEPVVEVIPDPTDTAEEPVSSGDDARATPRAAARPRHRAAHAGILDRVTVEQALRTAHGRVAAAAQALGKTPEGVRQAARRLGIDLLAIRASLTPRGASPRLSDEHAELDPSPAEQPESPAGTLAEPEQDDLDVLAPELDEIEAPDVERVDQACEVDDEPESGELLDEEPAERCGRPSRLGLEARPRLSREAIEASRRAHEQRERDRRDLRRALMGELHDPEEEPERNEDGEEDEADAPAERPAAIVPVDGDGTTRDQTHSRRKRLVRARTISMKRLTKRDLEIGRILNPVMEYQRPRTRGECAGGARPCLFVACTHNLYLDVSTRTGAIKLNFPDLEPGDLNESCALDVADRGGVTLEDVGAIMNFTRERTRQVEVKALARLEGCRDRGWQELADGERRVVRRLPVVVEEDEGDEEGGQDGEQDGELSFVDADRVACAADE